MGGFPDLSKVALERSETQQSQDFWVLGGAVLNLTYALIKALKNKGFRFF
ncbi:hypothetical protein [Nostoc sp. CCY0012]